jgi:hypothetical protein
VDLAIKNEKPILGGALEPEWIMDDYGRYIDKVTMGIFIW